MIKVGTLAKIRRLYFRDKQSIKEICRQTGMSRNTVRSWLRDPEMVEPKYPARVVVSKLDAYSETLSLWLKADSGRGKHLCGQLGSGSGAQTDKVLGLKFVHAEHVCIVLNPHKHVN